MSWLTHRIADDATRMSESGRVSAGGFWHKWLHSLALSSVARAVHVLLAVMFAGCVVPPPLTVDNDGGVNSPPNIISVVDPSFNAHRPPDVITIDNNGIGDLTVTIVENDVEDPIVLQLFVDYDAGDPHDADVNCVAPTAGSRIRTSTCLIENLCDNDDVGVHTLEIEVYDRPPDTNAPFRDFQPDVPGFFTTWTFDLQCQNPI
jgi:hypothetical protein